MSIVCESWNRFVLICKPEQSGKTFIMIQNIIKDLREPVDDRVVVNVILCDNNLLLTQQTGNRVAHDLEEFECNGESYIEFSSHKRTKYHDACSVAGAITTRNIKNVLCCTNGVRIEDIYTIVSDINKSPFTKDKIYWKIWLDEADKWPSFISTTFQPLVEEFNNIYVYCITATPKKLFDKYLWMNVLPLEETTTANYHGWEDNIIRIIDCDYSSILFIDYVLHNEAFGSIQPGTKWFIPGEFRKTSHYKIKDLCIQYGFAVIIVNGDGLKLFLPNLEWFSYDKDCELNTKLKYLYIAKNLSKYPLAITGNICIGRGISIMSQDFMIDYGILSVVASQQEVSQISGRLKGNIKQWSTYKKPTVFTTSKFNKIAIEWEKKSRHLAVLAFRKQHDGDLTIIKKSEFKTLGEGFEYVKHPVRFSKYTHAKEFLKTKSREMRCKTSTAKSEAVVKCDGYLISTRLQSIIGKQKDELVASDRLTIDGAKHIAESFGISSNKGTRYLILPVYPTMEANPRQVEFEVRYIKFK